MNSLTAPSTPNQHPVIHRSFTLPPRLSGIPRPRIDEKVPGPDAVETLFAHHAGKIVTFNAYGASSPPRSGSSVTDIIEDNKLAGILPWATHSERTIAAGQIRVYRVPGSVAFLSSGETVHPILPKSQCWCVDGETKFVLRVRQNTFYRIELPNTCTEDKRVAEEFKLSVSKVLQYETTPCPFKRGFHVELPESPQIPKKPWKPKHRPISLTTTLAHKQSKTKSSPAASNGHETDSNGDERAKSVDEAISESTYKNEPERSHISAHLAQATTSENVGDLVVGFRDMKAAPDTSGLSKRDFCVVTTIQASEAFPELATARPRTGQLHGLHDRQAGCPNDKRQPSSNDRTLSLGNAIFISEDDGTQVLDEIGQPKKREDAAPGSFKWLDHTGNLETPTKQKILKEGLAINSAVESKVESIWSPTSSENPQKLRSHDSETISIASSVDSLGSFHSFHSPLSPLPPSPSYSDTDSLFHTSDELKTNAPRTSPHRQNLPELTITTESFDSSDELCTPTWPEDSLTTSTQEETFSNIVNRPKHNMSTHMSSPSATLRQGLSRRRTHSPLPSPANLYTPKARVSSHRITSAILQKTCSLILGPPVQLVALMLNLAARFASGTLVGETYTHDGNGQPIPCSWELSEDEKEDDGTDEWEDDYGILLAGTSEHKRGREMVDKEGGSWEID